MSLKAMVLMLLAVMGVLLTVLVLGTNTSSEWSTVAEQVAPVIVLIALVGVVLGFAFTRR